MSKAVNIVIPDGIEEEVEDTQPSSPRNLGRSIGTGPRTYAADPATVRSKIYATMGQRLPTIEECRAEIDAYYAVFMGRVDLPEINKTTDLMEFATAVLSRLNEMEYLIERAENDHIPGYNRGSQFQRFRTGELRAAQDTARKQLELGSRRLSYAQMIEGMRYQP